ncbi:histidine phosphatase family protein [Shimia sp.]|uniref:histidine phosphatase family protein n=1 Tax=Shimia sp. TaxID=1954381 RepID=UPI003BAA0559
MTEFPTIWFLRHGQTTWNAVRRVQGQLESDLTELGRAQAGQQADLIAPILKAHKPHCLVSPLRRAQQTAAIALGGHPMVSDARLAEAQAGVFQGMTMDEIDARYPEIYGANPKALDLFCAAPEGEGYAAFEARVRAVLESLDGPTVMVGHGLWGQVLRGLICGLSHAETAALLNLQGCVYELKDGRERVLQVE